MSSDQMAGFIQNLILSCHLSIATWPNISVNTIIMCLPTFLVSNKTVLAVYYAALIRQSSKVIPQRFLFCNVLLFDDVWKTWQLKVNMVIIHIIRNTYDILQQVHVFITSWKYLTLHSEVHQRMSQPTETEIRQRMKTVIRQRKCQPSET